MSNISELIRRLRELEGKATPRPWRGCRDGQCPCGYIYGNDGRVFVAKAIGKGDDVDPYPVDEQQNANLNLIVESCNSILPLREYIESLQRERDGLRKALIGLQSALNFYVEWTGPVHEDGCPEDDWCKCPNMKLVNDAWNKADAALKGGSHE